MPSLGSMKKLFCIITVFAIIILCVVMLTRKSNVTPRFKLRAKPLLSLPGSKPYHLIGRSQVPQNPLIDKLALMLKEKISSGHVKKKELTSVCRGPSEIANSCDHNQCLRLSFSMNLKVRISELVNPPHLQLPLSLHTALEGMARRVPGRFEFMILSAVSSNHFLEMQAFVQNVHANVYPNFQNFTLVLYDIGLTHEQRTQMVKFCKCQVLDFPYHHFPKFVRKNLCYSWKPIIIKAHIQQAKVVVWADASVRFKANPDLLVSLLQKASEKGVLLGSSKVISPFRTFRNTYHFFGDEPCVYLKMYQVQATIGFYRNDFFVDRAVLEPWVSCAISESCICPVEDPSKNCERSKSMALAWDADKGPIKYGLCHRFDQSVISLILHKLYRGFFHQTIFHVKSYMSIKRNDAHPYFDSLVPA